MNLQEILKQKPPFHIKFLPSELPLVSGVEYNSQKVSPGNIFTAIKGYASDGHKYIKEAEKNGASIIICEKPDKDVKIPQIIVSNSRRALSWISSIFYNSPSKNMLITGITGTNGKSTTASIIEELFDFNGYNTGSIGTIDYHFKDINGNITRIESPNTTPESKDLHKLLNQMKQNGVTHVVMEVSSHAISLERVADIDFNTIVFTNITQDHLDFHNTLDEYAHVKTDFILEKLKNRETKAVINIDDEEGTKMTMEAYPFSDQICNFSIKNSKADLFAENFNLDLSKIKVDIRFKNNTFYTESPLSGEFNLSNMLGAAGAAIVSGIAPQCCFDNLKKISPVNGRLEQVKNDLIPYIFIDYAHTPDALENVLKTLKNICKKRLICIFGCGGDRDKMKRAIMGKISSELADISIITSDNPRTENPDFILNDIEKGFSQSADASHLLREKDRAMAIKQALRLSTKEDCILIAGKGHEDYQIIGKTKLPFNDREVVLKELENIYVS